ncbi:hypothetical protein LCI18_011492 [Fusarium solani-melongenae]|uniref:Uncharacterized protein n=1 Tax=Fusarium solani subsp. cucurbitae TaxID=2747967 RepID=A0ACD3ZHY7_FUSSC|nr:hypothetical protein LCI18_011492 [Fusarium solani-melongenae]
MAGLGPEHPHTKASSAAPINDLPKSSDKWPEIDRLQIDDDMSPAEDDADFSDTSSNYSTISQDSLPPIHAYGHTYHGSGQLFTPNDASEAHRMALQHGLFKLCLDGHLVATRLPFDQHTLENPLRILDIGAGSGLWACDMAQHYPQVEILGIDLSSALLPKDVPPNVTFEIADATDPWPSPTYDFIHMRNLVGGGVRDWGALLASAYAHLKPGGQLEFTEIRPRFFDVDAEQADLPNLMAGEKPEIGAACLEFEMTFVGMCMKMGLDFDPVPRVPEWLADLGAEAIRERVDWLPVKSWGTDPIYRKKGEVLGEMIDSGLENWTMMLFGMCGWKENDTRALLDRVKMEVQDPMLRSYGKVTFITARKPFDDSEDE